MTASDWRHLLDLVRGYFDAAQTTDPSALGQPQHARAAADSCMAALNALYATLKHHQVRGALLERELRALQESLLATRAELAGTQIRERRARSQASRDDLTTLPNRSCFNERLEAAVSLAAAQQGALAVFYLDLDGFKAVNDTYGHCIGDELLRLMATRLQHALRAEDVVARLGGDEFACLLADFPSRHRLLQLARKLFTAVASPCRLGAHHLHVYPSIGIAIYPTDGETGARLIASADAAMYRAKRERTGISFAAHPPWR